MTLETVVSNPHKLWKFLTFFIPFSNETDTFQWLMLFRRLVFCTSFYHYLKPMQLFPLGSHCTLFNLVVRKLNIKKKKNGGKATIVLFWWSASLYECLLMVCCISGKVKLCWNTVHIFHLPLLFFYSALTLFPGSYHQFSLMPCSQGMMKDNSKAEFITIISLSSNR